MDKRTVSGYLFLVVLVTSFSSTRAGPSNATTNTTGGNTSSPGSVSPSAVSVASKAAATVKSQSTVSANSQANVQSQSPSVTQTSIAAGSKTSAPKQCIKGNCTAKGDDESCLKTIPGKCLFGGSCTKDVTKNATHRVVTVGCGKGACPTQPTTTTTTVKPSTPAPSTTTSTCCETHLCNQYQAPQSAAFGLRTNMFCVIGLLIFTVCI